LQVGSLSPVELRYNELHPALIKLFVRLGVSAALLYFVLRSIDLAAFWQRVASMNPAWIALALIVYAAQQVIVVWRWDRLLRAQHVEVTRKKLTAAPLARTARERAGSTTS
jgi:uncharacterized membrane protein YbhN (UPF0104 family)